MKKSPSHLKPKNRELKTFDISSHDLNFSEAEKWISASMQNLSIEIGCGVGFHPIDWSKKNPSERLLAIERTQEKFEKFQRRYINHGSPKNIFPLHADANVALPHLIRTECVENYFVYYPNPYPKPKHKNLRFSFSPLTDYMFKTLKPGGLIHFATNLPTYADELKMNLPEKWPCILKLLKPIPATSQPRTHFEKKYLERGEPCIDIIFQKITRP